MSSQQGLAAARERLVQLAREGAGAWTELDVATLEAALSGRSAPAAPQRLVCRPARRCAAEVHGRGILAALSAGRQSASARVRHHARFLLRLLEPEAPEWRPSVSVVVPVYDAAELVVGAVRSALAQTHADLDVVVVDDGSRDHPERALASLLDGEREVRILRQENRGVSAARNTGIAAARGDWIHFLDADDTLHPDAVEKKLAALLAVPDADLCVSRYRSVGDDPGSRGAHGPGFGDTWCPTRDLLATWVRRYPFQTSTVLIPRWLLLETGPFEEEFPQGEDARYWFRLALRDAKVVALDEPLADRRFRAGSLSASESALGPVLFTMGLEALLAEPARWPYLGPLAVRMQGRERWLQVDAHEDPRLAPRRAGVLGAVGRLPEVALERDLAASVPAAILRRESVDAIPAEGGGFLARLGDALDAAMARSLPVTARDADLWGDSVVEEARAAVAARLAVSAAGPSARARAAGTGPSADREVLDVVVVPDFSGPASALFEARTRVFLGSWIEHRGVSQGWPLHLVCIGDPPVSVRELAGRAGAQVHACDAVDPAQPYLNKLRGLEVPSRSGRVLLLDADTVVLGDLSPALALGECFAALPAATNRIPERVWSDVFEACGVKPPGERMLPLIGEMEAELPPSVMREPFREEVPLHWNSGVVLAPVDCGLREAWEDAARTLAAAFAGSEWERHVCGNDQPSLAVGAARVRDGGLACRPLPPLLHGFDLFYASGRLTFDDTRIYHAKTFLRRAKDGSLDLLRECALYRSHQIPRLYPEGRVEGWLRRLRGLPHPRRAASAAALCDRLDALVRGYALDDS